MPEAKFLQGSLMRHVTVMSLTSSIGLLAVFVVDFVDMLFIAMLGKEELAAAVGYAGAILFFTTSISIGIAIAAGALVARALGAGNAAEARRMASHVMIFGVLVAVVVVALVMAQLGLLARLVGASGETERLTVEYLSIVVPVMPFLMLGMAAGATLRAYGDARRAMMATVAAGVVNAVLDPILIFGLDWELAGAAWATACSRAVMAAMALWPLLRVHRGLAPIETSALVADFRRIGGLAFPAMLTNVATPLGAAFVTRAMAAFGEQAVAGMAIIGRLTPVAFAVIFALSGAIGPIIGQNAGAARFDRVRQALRDGTLFTAVYIAAVALLLFLLRAPIAALFAAEGVERSLLYLFCGPLALAGFFNGVIFVGNAAFNNLGRPYLSTAINWGRNTLGTVPMVMLGASMFGAPGVLMGQAAGGVAFAAISWWLSGRLVEQLQVGRAAPTPRSAFAWQGRLMQLFHRR